MRFAVVLALIPVPASCRDLRAVPSTHLAERVHVWVPRTSLSRIELAAR